MPATVDESLRPFSDPASVAVVGASDDVSKWGHWLARGALAGADRRVVRLVNRRASQVLGTPAFARVADLPETPELLAVCVPGDAAADAVREGLARGSRGFLVISAGVPAPHALADEVRAAGARLIGPNSLGVYDAATGLQLAWGRFTPGALAIVSQSGQLGSEVARRAERAGIGISRFSSIGSQLDVTAADLLADLVAHEPTRLVALYLEGVVDGARLIEALAALTAAGKRALVLTAGASAGSRRLAVSHTGSLTSPLDVVDAVCRATGAIRVSTPAELVDVAACLLAPAGAMPGRRVAIVSDSGGQGGVAADAAARAGLEVAEFSPALRGRLGDILPGWAAVANPVDLAGAGEADLDVYGECVARIAASGEVDAVVLSGYLGCYGEDNPAETERELAVVRRLGRIAAGGGPALAVHSMSVTAPAVAQLRSHGVPVFDAIENACAALARTVVPPARRIPEPDAAACAPSAGYWGARTLLGRLGVAVPAAQVVRTEQDARRAADALRFPLVLKAAWLAHKTEQGGVVLGIGSADELVGAYRAMRDRLGDGDYVVEEQDQRSHVVEMLVGARRDPDFGPLIAVGAGGTRAELQPDVSLELAPVDLATAQDMVRRLRCAPLLAGWRGAPPADAASLADVVVAISHAIATDPGIGELEVNPVRVGPEGALAVDALITTHPRGEA